MRKTTLNTLTPALSLKGEGDKKVLGKGIQIEIGIGIAIATGDPPEGWGLSGAQRARRNRKDH
ncbi:MAG: hypothetical protein JW821_09000 [Deltaproteobacteria bacterium]|nr:hypothetical protein [Deltaproteobacteria bacterium]